MYRVVTVQYMPVGLVRKRVISKGPLHPDWQHANRWAEYLRSTGAYYEVRVGSNQSAASADMGRRS